MIHNEKKNNVSRKIINGYFPISLQYGDYTATDARDVSIAGGDPMETLRIEHTQSPARTATSGSRRCGRRSARVTPRDAS